MLKVKDFKDYTLTLLKSVEKITKNYVVIDDTQLLKFLKDIRGSEVLLIGIIPKHKFVGEHQNLQSNDIASFLVLTKMNRQDETHDTFLTNIENMQAITEKIIAKMLKDYDDENSCGFMRRLIPSSLEVNPIYGFASCDGYEIDFAFKTPQ